MENQLELTQKVNEVLRYSQDNYDIDATNIIKEWYEAKEYVIKNIFDGKYIINLGQVSVELDEESKQKKLDHFLEHIENNYNYPGLYTLIFSNKDDFFRNILSEDFYFNSVHVPSGMKMTKAFKFFVHDPDDLYDIQTEASRIIQEDRIKGELCFSVHPLDFLSLSENTYKWRSCHALNGDFRAGNLSYMLDGSTIICYIKGEDNVKLPRFPRSVPWNNKKWRMLLFVSNDRTMVFAGRQYPFFSMPMLDKIRSEYLHYCQEYPIYTWSQWHDRQFNFSDFDKNGESGVDDFYFPPYIPVNRNLYKLKDTIIDRSKLHFNDLLYSSVYKPYYMFNYYTGESNPPHFFIGSQVHCPCCGERYITNSEYMVCNHCASPNEEEIEENPW